MRQVNPFLYLLGRRVTKVVTTRKPLAIRCFEAARAAQRSPGRGDDQRAVPRRGWIEGASMAELPADMSLCARDTRDVAGSSRRAARAAIGSPEATSKWSTPLGTASTIRRWRRSGTISRTDGATRQDPGREPRSRGVSVAEAERRGGHVRRAHHRPTPGAGPRRDCSTSSRSSPAGCSCTRSFSAAAKATASRWCPVEPDANTRQGRCVARLTLLPDGDALRSIVQRPISCSRIGSTWRHEAADAD